MHLYCQVLARPSDALRRTCLRSQVAAGHNVTVYSFDPIADLPDGCRQRRSRTHPPYALLERLRPPQSDGIMARLDHAAVQRFLHTAADGRKRRAVAGPDVLLLKPIDLDPAKPYFAWERRRQIGNSVLYPPARDPIVLAFEALLEQDELTPEWLALRHRLSFALRRAARRIAPGFRSPCLRFTGCWR